MVPLFGAAYAAPNKGTTRLYLFRSQKTVLNPPVNCKIKDFSRHLNVFPVLFKANLIVKDFSRQSCIFKYFSGLCEPCYRRMTLTNVLVHVKTLIISNKERLLWCCCRWNYKAIASLVFFPKQFKNNICCDFSLS